MLTKTRLAAIDGDWHEFESKALRKENERRDREARKSAKEKEKKRPVDNPDSQSRDPKRVNVGDKTTSTSNTGSEAKQAETNGEGS